MRLSWWQPDAPELVECVGSCCPCYCPQSWSSVCDPAAPVIAPSWCHSGAWPGVAALALVQKVEKVTFAVLHGSKEGACLLAQAKNVSHGAHEQWHRSAEGALSRSVSVPFGSGSARVAKIGLPASTGQEITQGMVWPVRAADRCLTGQNTSPRSVSLVAQHEWGGRACTVAGSCTLPTCICLMQELAFQQSRGQRIPPARRLVSEGGLHPD